MATLALRRCCPAGRHAGPPPDRGDAVDDRHRAQYRLRPGVLEKRLPLPTGAAFAIFAVGRTVGWIAHALEQWRDGTLIRPRAVYPEEATRARNVKTDGSLGEGERMRTGLRLSC